MTAQGESAAVTAKQFAERHRPELVPLGHCFSYYTGDLKLTEEDFRDFLQEPIASLPPAVAKLLPEVQLFVVPYLEQGAGDQRVTWERPEAQRTAMSAEWQADNGAVLMLAFNDGETSDHHYRFFRLIGGLLADRITDEQRQRFAGLVHAELNAAAYGEVDEESWNLKQALLRKTKRARLDSEQFQAYGRQAFIDSMTLFLHGLCCDIDVEPGPRQLPSKWLRKRLLLLREMFPPGSEYCLFPEELKQS